MTPVEGLLRLRAAAESGALDVWCAERGIAVMTVFGSVVRHPDRARDLDVAVLPERGRVLDLSALVVELMDLTGVDLVDLADLSRAGPVLRERALVGCVALFEARPGDYAAAQIAAIGERVDTDANRRLALSLLAS